MNSINPLLKISPAFAGFHRDPLTLGPVLPPEWDGDAWMKRCDLGYSYCVRAWRAGGREVYLGRGIRYEDAARSLREQVKAVDSADWN